MASEDPRPVPVIANLRRSFRLVTGTSLAAAIAWCTGAGLAHGAPAFALAPYQPWSDAAFPREVVPLAIPCLAAAPLLLAAYARARAGRVLRSARWFLWAVFVFALLRAVASGVQSPGWFVQPLLVTIAALAFGPKSGLGMAGLAAAALLACAQNDDGWPQAPAAFALPVIGILVGGGLVGALLHRIMQGLLAV
jgi:hypothetical protein